MSSESIEQKDTPKSIWNCDNDINEMLPAGTILILPNVWSMIDEGTTPSADIKITLDQELSIKEALCLVEDEALEYVKSYGAKGIRQYYIEGLIRRDNTITFFWGT